MSVELSQVILNHGLTFLAVSTAVILIVVGCYLVKLLKDLSVLAKNVNETSIMLNCELKPTLEELNETIHSINSLVQSTYHHSYKVLHFLCRDHMYLQNPFHKHSYH